MSSKNRIPIKGSERAALSGAYISGVIDPNERIIGSDGPYQAGLWRDPGWGSPDGTKLLNASGGK